MSTITITDAEIIRRVRAEQVLREDTTTARTATKLLHEFFWNRDAASRAVDPSNAEARSTPATPDAE